jgi:hypothetical protein
MDATTTDRRPAALLLAILVAAAVLRFLICARGGQYFMGDEGRFDRGQQLYVALGRGDGPALRAILALPEHAAFVWLGAGVTAVQRVLASATPFGDWSAHPEHMGFSIWIGACVLSVFSTLNILWVALLARALGSGPAESLWAALLMAVSNTAFYYSRHLVPYDAALCFALAGLWVGLRYPRAALAALAGLLAGACYSLYNGYWFLPPVVAGLLLLRWRGQPRFVARAGGLILGLGLGLGVPLLIGSWAGGLEYWRIMGAFSRTVTLGLYTEGWSLPWAYLRDSEGCLGLAVAAVIVLGVIRAARSGEPLDPRLRTWLLALAAIYGLLVLFSVGLHVFVVYGRTVKPLVPFLCLAGGWAFHRLLGGRGWLPGAVAAGLVAGGALMVAPHFSFLFPGEIEVIVLRHYGNPKHAVSVSGSIVIPLSLPVTRPDLALVNAQNLYPVRRYLGFPAGQVLIRLDHVLTYRPYQYEGHTPKQREFLRTHDISIQLIKLKDPAAVPDNVPYELRNQWKPDGKET